MSYIASRWDTPVGEPTLVQRQHLPNSVYQLVREVQWRTKAPFETVLTAILTATATAYGGFLVIESDDGRRMPLSLNCLVLSPTGESKSSVTAEVLKPLFEFDRITGKKRGEEKEKHRARLAIWRSRDAALKKKMATLLQRGADNSDILHVEAAIYDHSLRQPKLCITPRFVVTDTSLPGLQKELSGNHKSIMLANPDAADFLHNVLSKHPNQFCSAWSGEPLVIVKHNREINCQSPSVSILAMAQPELAGGVLDEDHPFRTSGLAARFLVFMPETLVGKKALLSDPGSTGSIERWGQAITTALKNNLDRATVDDGSNRKCIYMSKEGSEFLKSRAADIDQDIGYGGSLSVAQDFSMRIVEQANRLAAIFELLNNPDAREISLFNAELAYDFLIDHYNNSVLKLMDPARPKMSTVSKAEKIKAYLVKRAVPYNIGHQQVVGVPMSLFQRNGPIRRKANVSEALALLEAQGTIIISELTFPEYGRAVRRKFICLNRPPLPSLGMPNSNPMIPIGVPYGAPFANLANMPAQV